MPDSGCAIGWLHMSRPGQLGYARSAMVELCGEPRSQARKANEEYLGKLSLS